MRSTAFLLLRSLLPYRAELAIRPTAAGVYPAPRAASTVERELVALRLVAPRPPSDGPRSQSRKNLARGLARKRSATVINRRRRNTLSPRRGRKAPFGQDDKTTVEAEVRVDVLF